MSSVIPNGTMMFNVGNFDVSGDIREFDAMYAALPVEFLKATARVTASPISNTISHFYAVHIRPHPDAQPLLFADLLDKLAVLAGAPRLTLQDMAERIRTEMPPEAQSALVTKSSQTRYGMRDDTKIKLNKLIEQRDERITRNQPFLTRQDAYQQVGIRSHTVIRYARKLHEMWSEKDHRPNKFA